MNGGSSLIACISVQFAYNTPVTYRRQIAIQHGLMQQLPRQMTVQLLTVGSQGTVLILVPGCDSDDGF